MQTTINLPDSLYRESQVLAAMRGAIVQCAFAHAARLTLVTFDAKIPPRKGVDCLVLNVNPGA